MESSLEQAIQEIATALVSLPKQAAVCVDGTGTGAACEVRPLIRYLPCAVSLDLRDPEMGRLTVQLGAKQAFPPGLTGPSIRIFGTDECAKMY